MEELSTIAKGGIGAALSIVAAIAFLWFRARQNRVEKDEGKRAELEKELKDANAKYAAMLFGETDPARIAAQKRVVDRLRRKLGIGAAAILCAMLATGCRTAPEVRTVVLSDHCRTIAPGDTVPDLPKGEPRWWLCTPTGLRLMLPEGSEIPEVAE